MIKLKHILMEQGIADDDAMAAKKIKNDLIKVGKSIETGFAMINKEVSQWNAPGLRTWVRDAISKGIVSGTKGFDRRTFEKHVEDWYKGR